MAIFRHVTDLVARAARGDIVFEYALIAHTNVTAAGCAQPGDTFGEFGLSVTVDAGDTQHFSRANLQADLVQRLYAAVVKRT